MKKKWMLALCLGLMVCMLSGCMSMLAADSLFGSAGALKGADVQEEGDQVTISREEYERYRQFDELLELMDAADAYFYQEPDHQKMLQGASAGLMEGLEDYYSFYYTPEAWTKMWEEDEGEYAGVGILISSNYATGICKISRVFEGSPAEKAGVRRGDILYRVGEDLYVVPETLQDAVDIMRGTPGTSVDVTFLRNGEEITFTLERAIINVNQIESTMLTEDVGLIAMYEFAGKCDEEFESALTGLMTRGAKGLIIDLRDNPGGWVDAARNIGDLFLDKGDLCYLVYRDGTESHDYPTFDGKVEIPLVLLVNENSASASEILTAALRERADATVVGVNTYGKGIVQIVSAVGTEGSGFQMTIAEYLTPQGNQVHKVGLAPDVEIPLEEGDNGEYDFADAEKDPQLAKALEVMLTKMGSAE
ncbi:MAG: S41 family peptidase [Clostridia bacterium]|nr:S41 family peptidase [Clostridia bacterium]